MQKAVKIFVSAACALLLALVVADYTAIGTGWLVFVLLAAFLAARLAVDVPFPDGDARRGRPAPIRPRLRRVTKVLLSAVSGGAAGFCCAVYTDLHAAVALIAAGATVMVWLGLDAVFPDAGPLAAGLPRPRVGPGATPADAAAAGSLPEVAAGDAGAPD